MKALAVAGRVLLPDGTFSEQTLLVQDGKIASIETGADSRADIVTPGWIIPGMIDLQVNGGFGFDLTADPSSAASLAEKLPATGVTALLPTIISSPIETYRRTLDVLQAIARENRGARILGVHLEGPYLNPQRAGAHNRAFLRLPSVDEMVTHLASPFVRLVTLAPELPGALDLVRHLRENGITVSAGHSDATFDQACAGFDAGITWGTHLFNAMSPLEHRAPGLVGALLSSQVACGLIVDGIHVHPAAVQTAWRAKGAKEIVLVTDAMAAMGMAPGRFALGDREVIVAERGTSARLADGTLAGSTLQMDAALRNFIEYTGASLADAVTAASTNPARLIGADKGKIAMGHDADLVGLNAAYQVDWTMVAGQVVYAKSAGSERCLGSAEWR